jgi:hypothetical protein
MESQLTNTGYRIKVPAEFDEVFSHFYYVENISGKDITKTLMPSFQTTVIFNFGSPIIFITKENEELEIPNCLIAGPIKHAITYTLTPGAKMLAADLKHDAFFRFFCTSMLEDHLHPNDLVNDDSFTILWNELNLIESAEDKVEHILSFSRPFLQGHHPLAEKIIAVANNGLCPIKEVSYTEQISERSVQMKLKDHFGYSARESSA